MTARLGATVWRNLWKPFVMAGYSDTPLAAKLGVRPDDVVFLDRPTTIPAEIDAALAPARIVTRLPRSFRVAITFQTEPVALERRLPALQERMESAGMVWICWPKKSARALGVLSALDDAQVRRIGLATGLVDVKVCAVDEIWSGLKFVRRVADR